MKSVKWPNKGETSVGRDAARRADFAEITGDFSSQAFGYETLPLLFDIGIVPLRQTKRLGPNTFSQYRPSEFSDTLTATPSPDDRSATRLVMARNGGNGSVISGWLEVGKGAESLPKRYQIEYTDTKYRYDINVVYDKITPGRWGAKKWTYLVSRAQQVAVQKVESRVVSTDYNYSLRDEDFELKPTKGMIHAKIDIADSGKPQAEDPLSQLSRVEASGRLTPLTVEGESPSSKRWYVRWVIAASVASIAALSWIRWRRLRRK